MGLCKLSSEIVVKDKTQVDNLFINYHLKFLSGEQTKLYLYGLFLAQNSSSVDNCLSSIANVMNIDEEDVKSLFYSLQTEGLVAILNEDDFEVAFLAPQDDIKHKRIYSTSQYSEFNRSIQAIISGRMISVNEYQEYYCFLESMHMEKDALLMIAKFCVNSKNNRVGYPYILSVAKNFAYQGILTCEKLNDAFVELETRSGEVKDVLKALGKTRATSFEDKDLYNKWTKTFGFTLTQIVSLARLIKKPADFADLDKKLETYYKLEMFDIDAIKEYEQNYEKNISVAEKIATKLGLKLTSYESTVEIYLNKWHRFGFDNESLLLLSTYAFKTNCHTLESMDALAVKFYKKGLTSIEAINNYIQSVLAQNEKYEKMLKNAGVVKGLTSSDREMFDVWLNEWLLPENLVEYALVLGAGKVNPISYVNKILINWKSKGIDSLDKAKQEGKTFETNKQQSPSNFTERTYSVEELNKVFTNLDDISII